MNTKLITALRTAAKALEDGTFAYDWGNSASCNCGVLAACILGKSQNELKSLIPSESRKDNSWAGLVGRNCPVTGIPVNELFRTLFSCGLTAKDLVDLEGLSNPQILGRMPEKRVRASFFKKLIGKSTEVGEIYCDEKADVINYFRAWADLLVENGKDDVTTEATKDETATLA